MDIELDAQEDNTLQAALEAFIGTSTLEQALQVLKDYPQLLTDQADILLSTLINSARQQDRAEIASALDERRDFLRSVRENLDNPDQVNH